MTAGLVIKILCPCPEASQQRFPPMGAMMAKGIGVAGEVYFDRRAGTGLA